MLLLVETSTLAAGWEEKEKMGDLIMIFSIINSSK